MLMTFKIILYALIIVFSVGTIGEEDKTDKKIYACVAIASILGLALLFTIE
jgi:hypothetical protein